MKIKIALGTILLSISTMVFASPQSYPNNNYNNHNQRNYSHKDNNYSSPTINGHERRHHPRPERSCFMNGRAYSVGSRIKDHGRLKVCERVRGQTVWIQKYPRR